MKDAATEHSSQRIGRGMYIAMWLVVLALLTLGFNHWLERERNPNRNPQGSISADGTREVTLQRGRHGHYLATGRINGQSVTFLLDTGASDVSIPGPVASRLGLERGAPRQYRTANGVVTAYMTQLQRVELGPLELTGIRASINPHMDGEEILLGMSFLRELELIQRGDSLTLRQSPH